MADTNATNSLYVLQTLKNHSDKDHPMTIQEITDKLNEDFEEKYPKPLSSDTVRRCFNEYFPKDLIRDDDLHIRSGTGDINDVNNWGFYLRNIKKGRAETWYYESVFLPSELMIIKNAIEAYSFLAPQDIANITKKLSGLRPLEKDLLHSSSRAEETLKDEDSLVMETIDLLTKANQSRTCAEIEYSYYDENLV